MARIECVSKIGTDGTSYILVFGTEPEVRYDLWEGGVCFSFDFNHRKQKTKVFKFTWTHGVPDRWETISEFKDEILSEKECLEWVENYMKVIK